MFASIRVDIQHDWLDYVALIVARLAAVGTVGAVVVALWQVRGQPKCDLNVSARIAVIGALPGRAVSVSVTNDGYRPIKINGPPEFMLDDGYKIVAMPLAVGERPPLMLLDGESATFLFDQESLDLGTAGKGCTYTYVHVWDAAGNVWWTPFPGYREPSKGLRGRMARWRLMRKGVPPGARLAAAPNDEGGDERPSS